MVGPDHVTLIHQAETFAQHKSGLLISMTMCVVVRIENIWVCYRDEEL